MAEYTLAATDKGLHAVALAAATADEVTVAMTADYVLMVHPDATEPVYVAFSPVAVADPDATAVWPGFGLELASVPGGTVIYVISAAEATYTLERTSADAVRYAIAAAGGGGIIGTITPEDIGAAPAEHTHEQADVTGLVSALAGKAATSHNHTGTYAPASHTHTASQVTDLAEVASTGAYGDLSGTPTIPSGAQLLTGSASAIADIEAAPTLEDFNGLLAVLRTRGVLSS